MVSLDSRSRAWSVAASVAVLIALFSGQAVAADFRIRLHRQQGKQVHIYHDRVQGGLEGTVEINIGATQCKPDTGEVLKPGRGGDSLATLIVLDRGGTKTTGMGQYSEAMRNAVGGFLESIVGKGPGDKVAIIDTAGRDTVPHRLGPTDKAGDVKAFLAGLPDPSGSGADVYGVANMGLAELDNAGCRLGAVILISDGIDPTAEATDKATDNQALFIREARKRGVPVAAIHVDRSGDKKADAGAKFRNGRARLVEVANETNGDLRYIAGDAQLETNLRQKLDDLGQLFSQVDRTTCTLCGKTESKDAALIDFKVKKGATVIGQSLTSPPPRISVAADDYGSCDLAATASTSEAGAVGPSCKVDQDCDANSKCAEGHCAKRRTIKDLVPWLAAGLVGLGLLLGLFAWRRAAKRRQELAAAEARQREASLREQLASAETARRVAESAALAAANREPVAAGSNRDADVDRLLNPEIVRLQSAPGSAETFDRVLKAGVYLVGGGEDVDLRFHSPTVSTHHAQLDVDRSGVIRVMDLKSSNGTFVNQTRIAPRLPVELRVGDTLSLSLSVVLQVYPIAPSGGNGPNVRNARGGRTVLGD